MKKCLITGGCNQDRGKFEHDTKYKIAPIFHTYYYSICLTINYVAGCRLICK